MNFNRGDIRIQRTTGVLCLLYLLLAITAGCSGTPKFPMRQQKAPLPPGPICRVAVLPFLNDSEFPLADAIVQKVFAAQLQQAGNYQMAQDGDIFKTYQQLHILPGEDPVAEQMKVIADRANAQLLFTGTVLEMREDRGEYGTVDPLVVIELQIRDGVNGEVLWTTLHRRKGSDYKKTMHFGTIHTVTGLSRQMAEEIINLWLKKGLAPCNVLSQS